MKVPTGDAARMLVVGAGLIGAPVAADLRQRGLCVQTVSRSPRLGSHLQADLSTLAGREGLRRQVRRWRPDRVLLVAGPADVGWMEDHETEATATHVGVAEAVSDVPTLTVSTDNVFDGHSGLRTDVDRVDPANAYGRVKLAAERAAAGGVAPTVARVSLVFGAAEFGRADFVRTVAERAFRDEPFAAPDDQYLTPICIDDVVHVLVAILLAPPRRMTLHLAGPRQVTRYELAREVYRLVGADPSLVRPVPKAQTRWACRPHYSSLTNSDHSAIPGLEDWAPRNLTSALADLLGRESYRALGPP